MSGPVDPRLEAFVLALLDVLTRSFGVAEIEAVVAILTGTDPLDRKLLEDISSAIAGVVRVILEIVEPAWLRDELAKRYDADDLEIARAIRAKFPNG